MEAQLNRLTPQESLVLYHRCKGLKIKEIAEQRSISERTVHFHLGNIYEKLELTEVDAYDRLRMLDMKVCPVHLERVQNAESRRTRKAMPRPEPQEQPDEETPAQPAKETLALVLWEDDRGLIPQQWALVPIGGGPMLRPTHSRMGALLLVVGIVVGGLLGFVIGRQSAPSGMATPVSPASPAPIGTQVYESRNLNFGFQYPSGWQIEDSNRSDVVVKNQDNVIQIGLSGATDNKSLDYHLEVSVRAACAKEPTCREVRRINGYLKSGEPYKLLEYTTQPGAVGTGERTVGVFTKGTQVYLVLGITSGHVTGRPSTSVEEILNSLSLH